jgi:sarcosine oxidase subunit alpha
VTVETSRRLSGISRGRRVQIVVDEVPVQAYEGESVAASLLAAGRRGLRVTPRGGEPRGMYCGIGVCFDCVMTFDGERAARACLTPVRDGLRVETRKGDGTWPSCDKEVAR